MGDSLCQNFFYFFSYVLQIDLDRKTNSLSRNIYNVLQIVLLCLTTCQDIFLNIIL